MSGDAAVDNDAAAHRMDEAREENASDAKGDEGRSEVPAAEVRGMYNDLMQIEQDASRTEDEHCAMAIVPFERNTGTAEEQALVPFEADGAEEEEGKDGWEAAREWLWTLPRRRNVVYEEVEEWLQNNKHRLSREILTIPRAHLFRFLVSQHKLMRRTEQKENLELVEPPTARFRRSDKWRPVYAWLESLDTRSVVGTRVIDAWLSKNPAVKEELLGKHTRHHLFHYIQKCHTNILKKRTKEVPNDSKGHHVNSNGKMNTAYDGLENDVPSIMTYHKDCDAELSVEDAGTGMTSMYRAEAKRRYEILLELRTQLFEQIAMTRELMRKSSAQETASLWATSSTATFVDDYDRPGHSGAVLRPLFDGHSLGNEDFEGRSRQRSRDSASLQQEIASSSVPSQRYRSFLDGKKRRKGKEKFDNVALSWSFSEFVTEQSSCSEPRQNGDFGIIQSEAAHSMYLNKNFLEKGTSSQISGDKVRHFKGACNPVRCLQERETGAGIGTVISPFKWIGRGRHSRWKPFIQGWQSIERQFTGCAVCLQRSAFSTWLPCWSAYTSSVAVAAPLGMIDQGVQKVLDVRFHPHNLPNLVCSSNEAPNELLLYDLLAGRATELVGHNSQIQAVEYAVDGRCIVSCGRNIVKIWDSNTGACLHTLGPGPWAENAAGHREKINAMAVNEEQSDIVATSGSDGDGQLLLWNVNRGELACDLNMNLRRQFGNLPCMDALEFCKKNLLICGSDSTSGGPAILQIWDVCVPEIVTSFPANDSYITSIKVDPAGKLIASGAGDGSVALVDLRTCRGIVRLPLGSSYEVTSVSFSSCGTYFQASTTANRTLVWDARMLPMEAGPGPTQSPLELADRESRTIRALHCLSHGTPMPTSENAGQMPGFVDEGDQGVNDARWFHDTPILVTVSGNGSIAIWDIQLGDPCIKHLISHSRCVNTVAVSPDDKYICSGGDDQKVVLYRNTQENSSSRWRLTHPLLENFTEDSICR